MPLNFQGFFFFCQQYKKNLKTVLIQEEGKSFRTRHPDRTFSPIYCLFETSDKLRLRFFICQMEILKVYSSHSPHKDIRKVFVRI